MLTLWKLNSTVSLENPLSFSLFEEDVFGDIFPVHFLFLQGFENFSVYGLSPFWQWFSNHITRSSLSLYQRMTVFLNTQERSNKSRVFEYSVFLQQLWCIDLRNSFGNTWYRSNILCFVLVFQNNNNIDYHLLISLSIYDLISASRQHGMNA